MGKCINIFIWLVFCLLAVLIVSGFIWAVGNINSMDLSPMERLPDGELIASSQSPGGKHVVNIYLCKGGATVADSIRAEVVTGNTKRNIYWQYKESECMCEWASEDVVCINGRELNVTVESYDWRQDVGGQLNLAIPNS